MVQNIETMQYFLRAQSNMSRQYMCILVVIFYFTVTQAIKIVSKINNGFFFNIHYNLKKYIYVYLFFFIYFQNTITNTYNLKNF